MNSLEGKARQSKRELVFLLSLWTQLVIAVVSLFLAWKAIRLTEAIKEDDDKQEELMITPKLMIDIDIDALRLKL